MTGKIGILGGGVAGLSLAYFLENEDVSILEKQAVFGGLARSYKKNGISYDVGPHIFFSKNKPILELMNRLAVTDQHKRSNQIFYKGRFVTYPFENFLAQTGNQEDIEYCVRTFLSNPYENMQAGNMQAFFLKTFGEGITKLYLQPYNEKIWKFDPSMMDTQMVERIPKPPKEDIVNGAKGKYSEGYLHQLYFHYPRSGGTQSLVDGFVKALQERGTRLLASHGVQAVEKTPSGWRVATDKGDFEFERIVNCMPLHLLLPLINGLDPAILETLADMKYNSICVMIINVAKDNVGNHFAVYLPQSDVIFHRISKLDFMGGEYHLPGSSTFLAEVTFREDGVHGTLTDAQLVARAIQDMVRIGFIDSKDDVRFTDTHREKLAYVIYDLNHRRNTDRVLGCLRGLGIECAGRFAEFEYMNMDKIIEHSLALSERIKNGAGSSPEGDRPRGDSGSAGAAGAASRPAR